MNLMKMKEVLDNTEPMLLLILNYKDIITYKELEDTGIDLDTFKEHESKYFEKCRYLEDCISFRINEDTRLKIHPNANVEYHYAKADDTYGSITKGIIHQPSVYVGGKQVF
jgi:hypothetical protein